MPDNSTVDIKRKRGRPVGSRNAFLSPWQPLVWEPIYEQMVALSLAGMSYQMIGNRLGYSGQQVGNVIRSPEAQSIKAAYLRNIRDSSVESVTDLREIATKRVADLLRNDDLAEGSPFRMFEAAAKLLTGIGQLRGADNSNTVNNTLMLSPEGENKLIAAIQKSDEARLLNDGSTK